MHLYTLSLRQHNLRHSQADEYLSGFTIYVVHSWNLLTLLRVIGLVDKDCIGPKVTCLIELAHVYGLQSIVGSIVKLSIKRYGNVM